MISKLRKCPCITSPINTNTHIALKLIVATHKDKSIIENNIIRPIQVGAGNTEHRIDKNYYLDNSGSDHISEKNPNYSEMSALYWMWKNLADEDVVGLMHYRRYFNLFQDNWLHRIKKVQKKVSSNHKLLRKIENEEAKTRDNINKWLEDYDVILPPLRTYSVNRKPATIAEDYRHHHRATDWDTCMEIIKELYPEYEPSIDLHLYNSLDKFYMCNMFIAPSKWMMAYAEWMFSVLFALESKIKVPNEDPYQKRVFAFMAERLTSLYVHHNKFKVKHVPLILVEDYFKDNPEVTHP